MADSRDGEEFDETSDVVTLLDERFLIADLGNDVVEIASCLKLSVAETLQRCESSLILALLNIPSWRLCIQSAVVHWCADGKYEPGQK